MPFYHVLILHKSEEEPPLIMEDYQLNLSRTALMTKIIEPYLRNEPFRLENPLLAGIIVVYPKRIAAIHINKTTRYGSFMSPSLRSYYPNALDDCFTYSDDEEGKVVTNEFIPSKEEKTFQMPSISSKNIFIVHGRDHKPMKELKAILEGFGLNPIVLHEKASGGLTLVEKLERYSEKVGYAFVILTPDDVGCLKGEVRKVKSELKKPFLERSILIDYHKGFVDELFEVFKRRARQNVIFEMGYFWGLLKRKRACCLLKGDVEKPSDIEGIVYIPFKDSVNEVRDKIIKELKEAGYEIKEISKKKEKWSSQWKDAN